MTRARTRVGALVCAAALALSSALTATPAQAVETGTLRVHLVDSTGAPVDGTVFPVPADGSYLDPHPKIIDTDFVLPVGSYGVYGLTAWGGLTCVGLQGCVYSGTPTPTVWSLDPATALQVNAGQVTEVTIKSPPPATVTGTPQVGGLLTVALSSAMQGLLAFLQSSELPGAISYQWVRDGDQVVGVGPTYAPVAADAGHVVAVKLVPSGGLALLYFTPSGGGIGTGGTPITVAPTTIRRMSTTTHVAIGRSPITTKEQTILRVDVTGGGVIVRGAVVVVIGKRKRTLTLRNGQAVMRVSKLKKGTYVVRAVYRGSSSHATSTSAKRKLVVTQAKR